MNRTYTHFQQMNPSNFNTMVGGSSMKRIRPNGIETLYSKPSVVRVIKQATLPPQLLRYMHQHTSISYSMDKMKEDKKLTDIINRGFIHEPTQTLAVLCGSQLLIWTIQDNSAHALQIPQAGEDVCLIALFSTMQLNKPVLSAIAITKHGLYRYWKQTTVNNNFIEGKFELPKGETLSQIAASPESNIVILSGSKQGQLYQVNLSQRNVVTLDKISFVRKNDMDRDSPYDFHSLQDIALAVEQPLEQTSSLIGSVYSWFTSWGADGPSQIHTPHLDVVSRDATIQKLSILPGSKHLYVLRAKSFERWSLQDAHALYNANASPLWVQDFHHDILGLDTNKETGKTHVLDMHCALHEQTERITILIGKTSSTFSTSDVPLMIYELFQFEYKNVDTMDDDNAMQDDDLEPTLRLHHIFGTHARDMTKDALRTRVYAHHNTFYIISPNHLLIAESPFEAHLTHNLNHIQSIVMGGLIKGSFYLVNLTKGLIKASTTSSLSFEKQLKSLVHTIEGESKPLSIPVANTSSTNKEKVLHAFNTFLANPRDLSMDLFVSMDNVGLTLVTCSQYIANLTHLYALNWVNPSVQENRKTRVVITQLLQHKAKLHAVFLDFIKSHSLWSKLPHDQQVAILTHGELIEVALAIRQSQNPRTWVISPPLQVEELLHEFVADAIALYFKKQTVSQFVTPTAEYVFARVSDIPCLLECMLEVASSSKFVVWFMMFCMSNVFDRVDAYRQLYDSFYVKVVPDSSTVMPVDQSTCDPTDAIPRHIAKLLSRQLHTRWATSASFRLFLDKLLSLGVDLLRDELIALDLSHSHLNALLFSLASHRVQLEDEYRFMEDDSAHAWTTRMTILHDLLQVFLDQVNDKELSYTLDMVFSLSETYYAFDQLIDLCVKRFPNADRLSSYMHRFQHVGFVLQLLLFYYQEHMFDRILAIQSPSFIPSVELFVASRPDLAWMYWEKHAQYKKANEALRTLVSRTRSLDHQAFYQSIIKLNAQAAALSSSSTLLLTNDFDTSHRSLIMIQQQKKLDALFPHSSMFSSSEKFTPSQLVDLVLSVCLDPSSFLSNKDVDPRGNVDVASSILEIAFSVYEAAINDHPELLARIWECAWLLSPSLQDILSSLASGLSVDDVTLTDVLRHSLFFRFLKECASSKSSLDAPIMDLLLMRTSFMQSKYAKSLFDQCMSLYHDSLLDHDNPSNMMMP